MINLTGIPTLPATLTGKIQTIFWSYFEDFEHRHEQPSLKMVYNT